MTIDREQLAWAAGLFEGEGCFCGQFVGRIYYPKAFLASTDADVLARFQHVLGGWGNLRPRSQAQRPAHWKPIVEWNLTRFEHVQAFVALIWPWLHSRRRARAREILLLGRESRMVAA